MVLKLVFVVATALMLFECISIAPRVMGIEPSIPVITSVGLVALAGVSFGMVLGMILFSKE